VFLKRTLSGLFLCFFAYPRKCPEKFFLDTLQSCTVSTVNTAFFLSYPVFPLSLYRRDSKARMSHLGIVLPTDISVPDERTMNSEFSTGFSYYQKFRIGNVKPEKKQPEISAKTYLCSRSKHYASNSNQDRIEFRTKGTRFKYFKTFEQDGSLRKSHKINHGVFVRLDTRRFEQRESEFLASVQKAKQIYTKKFLKNRNNKQTSVMQKAQNTFAYNEHRN